jgi:hypothetical protein
MTVHLLSPHIPLGIPVADALKILARAGNPEIRAGDVTRFHVESQYFSAAIYPRDEIVQSVWYDDPMGRDCDESIADKVHAYLARHGNIQDWVMRMDNGWMRYWFNPIIGAQMVYGMHRDVIRFNQYSGS